MHMMGGPLRQQRVHHDSPMYDDDDDDAATADDHTRSDTHVYDAAAAAVAATTYCMQVCLAAFFNFSSSLPGPDTVHLLPHFSKSTLFFVTSVQVIA